MKTFPKLLLLLALFVAQAGYAQETFSLEDAIQNNLFGQRSVSQVNWMKDGRYYSVLENNNIVKYDITTGTPVETIVEGASLDPQVTIQGYEFSSDESKILLRTNTSRIYRYSYTADYFVYDVVGKTVNALSTQGQESYATFSPAADKVAFVRRNNLFVVTLADQRVDQITDDGARNSIINGTTDWVYEEEFGFVKGFFWSPNGDKLAFYTFDESRVKEYNMQVWSAQPTYPYDYRFKYPKAGEQNSIVKVSIVNLTDGKRVAVDIGTNDDIYIPRMQWTQDNNVLSVSRMNRLQNELHILHADAATGNTNVVLKEKTDTYIDINDTDYLTYLSDGKHFVHASEQDGYKHLYRYTVDGTLVNQITKGQWEVTSFIGIDEASRRQKVYYMSTEGSPLERYFYSVEMSGKNKVKLTAATGTHRVNMSNDFKYYLDYHSNATTPLNVSLYAVKRNSKIKTLEDNAELLEKAERYQLADKEFFTFETVDGTSLNGFFLKPNDFDANNKYPVVMYQYSGPGSQQVRNRWGGGHYYWHQYLVKQGYVVAVVDGRGTGGRGEAFKKQTYADLGKLEAEDQIATGRYLAGLPYVDGNRIGIWGWSFGGYVSSLCMFKGADVFKAGIAVAPVTNWRFYDTIYTERYLKRPQDNPDGYDKNSPVFFADRLRGKYLLIHGTGDDNVHFQNAVVLQEALIQAGKQFDTFYYPDKAHSLYGGYTRMHLYTMMTEFWNDNL